MSYISVIVYSWSEVKGNAEKSRRSVPFWDTVAGGASGSRGGVPNFGFADDPEARDERPVSRYRSGETSSKLTSGPG